MQAVQDRDRAQDSAAPTRVADILSPEWLANHVYADRPGLRIEAVETVWTLVNTATKVRAIVRGEGFEDHICVKGLLDEAGAPFLGGGTALTEAIFYRDMAPKLAAAGLNLPPCLYSGVDEEVGHGLIVMRDLTADGATFLTALTPYAPEQARDSLDQLALLHATTGPATALHDFPLTGLTLRKMADNSIVPLDLIQQLLDGPRADPLPAYLRDAARLHRGIGKLERRLHGDPYCLIHGDAHAANLYRQGDGAGIIDWQVIQRGHWAIDVAYHISAALTVENRRAHEDALLTSYLDARARHGSPVPDREKARGDYRAALIYGYYMWAVTRRVQEDITFEYVKRMGTAVDDHGSYALLGA